MQGWKIKLFSQARREILEKVIVQAIPTYGTQYFLLSQILVNKIMITIRRFSQGGDPDKKCIYWQKWDILSKFKSEGEMSFTDLKLFNLAFLAKQGWRLIINPYSFRIKIFERHLLLPNRTFSHRQKKFESFLDWEQSTL